MHYLLVLPRFPYSECLTDLRLGIGERLKSQGHTIELADSLSASVPKEHQVLFGANNCRDEDYDEGVIVYNGEAASSQWMQRQVYIDRLAKAHDVWDWNTIAPLCFESKTIGVERDPNLVVHYGSLSPRRFKACMDSGAKAYTDVFGLKLQKILQRSSVIIEPLYDETWEPCSLRLTVATSHDCLLLTECHPDPNFRLNLETIGAQVKTLLSFSDKERRKWIQNQQETVERWLELQ